jgi:hypothetical protein
MKTSWQCECGKSLKAERNAAGFPFTCPKCGKRGKIPKPAEVGALSRESIAKPESGDFSEDPSGEVLEIDESPEPTSRVASTPLTPRPIPEKPHIMRSSPPTAVLKRYPALRTVARVIRILGWAALVIGILWMIAYVAASVRVVSESQPSPIQTVMIFALALSPAFSGLVVWVFMLAISESILVLIDVEENSRLNFSLLQRLIIDMNDVRDS